MESKVDWAALEAAHDLLLKAQADLDRVPEETTVDWSACGAAATLIVDSFPAILKYHEQAEKVREAAAKVAGRYWGTSCSQTEHFNRMEDMDRLRAALGVKP